ncbi:MAG TPA: aspartate kinase, partial [bacterium]|nr:aspartate kinase [bacterium]
RLDLVKAFGEEWSARVLADAISKMGFGARFLDPREAGIKVTPVFGNASPEKSSYKNLEKLSGTKDILVVPGFYGATSSGETATFSRGGSDLTGSLIAAAVKARVYENFSDVPGIYAASPKLLKSPKPRIIPKLTFRELRELAYSGFSVFHDEAVQPILQHAPGVPIHVRHFAFPEKEGTWIVRMRKAQRGIPAGIAADFGFVAINLEKHMMNKEIGFGRKLLQIFEDHKISYEHSPSGIDSISVVFKIRKGIGQKEIDEIIQEIEKKLKPETIKVQRGLAMIAIVGEGMKESVGIAARATSAISDSKTNIEMITQGASEISIVYGVAEKNVQKTVRSLYKRLIAEAL